MQLVGLERCSRSEQGFAYAAQSASSLLVSGKRAYLLRRRIPLTSKSDFCRLLFIYAVGRSRTLLAKRARVRIRRAERVERMPLSVGRCSEFITVILKICFSKALYVYREKLAVGVYAGKAFPYNFCTQGFRLCFPQIVRGICDTDIPIL